MEDRVEINFENDDSNGMHMVDLGPLLHEAQDLAHRARCGDSDLEPGLAEWSEDEREAAHLVASGIALWLSSHYGQLAKHYAEAQLFDERWSDGASSLRRGLAK
jgi:hypothetical protein